MANPRTETIPRRGRGTQPDHPVDTGFEWSDIETRLRAGEGTCWLSVRGEVGVHTRPLFAAWTGQTFVFASRASAVKTDLLEQDGMVSLAVHLDTAHLVIEGSAVRVTTPADLERVRTAMDEVYGWPTTVVGDELDAPYAAPTSGGPPFRAYELIPERAHAFPTDDSTEPTRFLFGHAGAGSDE